MGSPSSQSLCVRGFSGRNDAIRAYRNLAAACLLVLISTFDTCFNIYAVDLKKTFSYTQTQLEMVAAAGMFGLFFALPCPLLLKKFGLNITLVITFFIAVPGIVGMGLLASFPETFSDQVFLFSVVQFMASNGCVYLLLIAIEISVTTFPIRHAGKLIGLLNAFCSIGNIFYVGLFSTFFGDTGNVAGLFFTSAVLVAVAIICYGILQNVAPARLMMELDDEIEIESSEPNHNSEKTLLIKKHATEDIELQSKNSSNKFQNDRESSYAPPRTVLTMPALLATCLFHLIAWPSSIAETIGYLYMNNISSMLESLAIPGSRDPFIIALTLGSSVLRVIIGIMFDAITSYTRRVTLLTSSSVLYIISILLILASMNSYAMVMLGTIVSGLGLGVITTISLAFLTYMFGKQNNIMVHGSFLTLTCFVQLGMHLLVGVLYDIASDHNAHVLNPDLAECVGNFCFMWALLIMLVLSSCSVGLFALLYIIKDIIYLYR